jgi:hypothetical protein
MGPTLGLLADFPKVVGEAGVEIFFAVAVIRSDL